MRDLPSSLDLLALARELLLDELVPLLSPERRREAHLIATTIAIAAREAKAGEGWQREIEDALADFYAEVAPHPNPLPARGEREHDTTPRPVYGEKEGPAPRAWEGEGQRAHRSNGGETTWPRPHKPTARRS